MSDWPIPVTENEPLAPHTTFRVGGAARLYAEPETDDELAAILRAARDRSVRVLRLGGGSNLLVADEGVDALVIRLGNGFNREAVDEDGLLRLGAATPLPKALREAEHHGLSGLEPWAAIPGTMGGAAAMNAGSPSLGILDFAEEIRLVDADGATTLRRGEWTYGYRDGGAGGRWVTEVALRLTPGDPAAIREQTINAAMEKRVSQPLSERSAGCVFRNPPGQSAGRLLDQAGVKNARRGGAAVSGKHANFIVNREDATAADILGLADEMREAVRRAHGIELAFELTVWK